MAISEIYVDPSIAGDSGTGTIGDPYGDLEYAIEQTTFDTTNGTRVNIKAGTDEVLAANLSTALADTSVSVAWVPTNLAPCVFQGYTSVAGDGGVGGISGGGSVPVFNNANQDGVHFIDLHLKNPGANQIIDLDNFCSLVNCEISGQTGGVNTISLDAAGVVFGCYIHDNAVSGNDVVVDGDGFVGYNYIKPEGIRAIIVSAGGKVTRNIIDIASTGTGGIYLTNSGDIAIGNSIYNSTAGTGKGIEVPTNQMNTVIINNLIEGFSGTGGIGISFAAGANALVYGGNSVFNCSTAFDAPDELIAYLGGNETLSASPFTSASTGDFSPVDTGEVKEGAVPNVIGGGLVP